MTQALKEYANSEMFSRLFDDVIVLVQKTNDYLEGTGRYDSNMLSQKEQNLFHSQSVQITDVLMIISELVLNYRAYSKGHTQTLKNVCFKPFNVVKDDNLPFAFNWLLIQSKHLYDRVQRIDEQFKNDNQSYFTDLKITLQGI